jgi:hypothetical protein
MNNDDNFFTEGVMISSFVKNSDRIWEGILITRTDGIKTVLNEQSGRWKKLSDLDNIKILTEDFTTLTGSISSAIGDVSNNENLTYSDLRSKFSKDIVGEDVVRAQQNAEKILGNKSALAAGAQELLKKANTELTDKSQAPENEATAARDFNEDMKQILGDTEAAKKNDNEEGFKKVQQAASINEQFHPSLQKYLNSMTSEQWYGNKLYESQDTEYEMNYEDDDYLDIPEEIKSDIIADIIELLKKNEENIEDKIKNNYEISDSDAEEFIVKAMEMYLKNTDITPKDSIQNITDDEVEKSFEKSIDDYEGPENGLLDYLADTYEIDTSEAEKIFEENEGKLTETILGFVKFIKNKLREDESRNPNPICPKCGEPSIQGEFWGGELCKKCKKESSDKRALKTTKYQKKLKKAYRGQRGKYIENKRNDSPCAAVSFTNNLIHAIFYSCFDNDCDGDYNYNLEPRIYEYKLDKEKIYCEGFNPITKEPIKLLDFDKYKNGDKLVKILKKKGFEGVYGNFNDTLDEIKIFDPKEERMIDITNSILNKFNLIVKKYLSKKNEDICEFRDECIFWIAVYFTFTDRNNPIGKKYHEYSSSSRKDWNFGRTPWTKELYNSIDNDEIIHYMRELFNIEITKKQIDENYNN